MKKRILSILLVLVMLVGMLPVNVFAVNSQGQVRVIVENTTYTVEEGAPWYGTLVDQMVNLTDDTTMMTAILTALSNNGHTWNKGSGNWDATYIGSVEKNGNLSDALGEVTDGNSGSGWMGTLNDWFVNKGFNEWKVSEDELVDGDVIRVMYTRNMGADIGGKWGTNKGYLSSLSTSAGTLSPAFDKETMNYTLTVDSNVTSVDITAVAENKEDKVTVSVGGTEYRRGVGVPVAKDTEITITCGVKTYTVVVSAAVPFSQAITLPSNGDSGWGYVSGLTLSGSDGGIYEAYWSSESNPYVLDVILKQDSPANAAITAAFTTAGMRAPSISGETTVTLQDGKGTINVTAVSAISLFYPDTNWTINLTVDDGSAADRPTYEVKLPTETKGYTVAPSGSAASPVIEGRKYSFKVTIDSDYKAGESFAVKANGAVLTAVNGVYTIKNITADQTITVEDVEKKTLEEMNVTIIAPAGSTISSGRFYSYFKYDFNEPLETTELEDGRISMLFPVPGSQGFLRVQNPDGVTYWDFDGLTAGSVFNITEEMLFINSTEYTKDTVYPSFEKNIYDKADLYLTVNAQGWLDMNTGDTHSLNVFRNWLALGNSIQNTSVALPDVEYKVISVDGTPSSGVVTVTPDKNNSCYADINAVGPGTAIILVSYDAVYNNDGLGGKQFSAIWPENTGVIVVTVDAENASITTNMNVNEEANAGGKQILDVEHDILFYVDEAGAEYSFKPEEGCTVTVARSTVGKEMTFNGFTADGITTEDGTVTISGLTTGTHIIKVEKDGKAVYQVIRARQVSYDLTGSDGVAISSENPAEPGETITVQFHNLISPLEKLSGVYNANFGFWYNGEDGTAVRTGGGYGMYDFSGNADRQKFTVTVPSDWNKNTLTLTDGAIKLGGFGGSFGAHRKTSYLEGKEVNTNASGTAGVASVLPDVVIPVYVERPAVAYTVTLPSGEGYTVAASGESDSPVTEGGSYSFTVTIADGYEAGDNFAVKANDNVLTAVNGVYTIENITADQTITVEDVMARTAKDEAAAKAVEEKIAAIGTVTLDSENAIIEARNAYDALTDIQKDLVFNIDALTAAEEQLAALQAPNADYEKIYQDTGDYLEALCENFTPVVNSVGGEWLVFGLARSDREVPAGYYDEVVKYVTMNINGLEQLDANKSTENSRVILALTAAGYDVTDVVGQNLLEGLTNLNYLKKQGINGPVWALIAFDSHDYEIPTAPEGTDQVNREKLIDTILAAQLDDGGWNVAASIKSADSDMTAMAITALAPYYDSDDAVKAAVDKALETLSKLQLSDGSFGSTDGSSAESCAQVLVALTAMGIDPERDARFIKTGNSVVDALCAFAVEGGGFKHVPTDTKADGMATEQGYYALNAYVRFLNEEKTLFNMTEIEVAVCEHKNTEIRNAAHATCAKKGYSGDTYCADCGQKLKSGSSIDAVGHKFGPWMLVEEAKIRKEGKMERTCSVCGEKEEKKVEKKTFPFTDVKETSYAYDTVAWAADENITAGMTATTFVPDGKVTRGQVVTFLWRAAGSPKAKNAVNPFADVKEGKFYYDAVLWAVENGITYGRTKTTFAPEETCTRAEVVTFLWRFAENPDISSVKNPFTDVKEGKFYYDAVLWAVDEGITVGIDAVTFGPSQTCTRAQIVTFLFRYMNK